MSRDTSLMSFESLVRQRMISFETLSHGKKPKAFFLDFPFLFGFIVFSTHRNASISDQKDEIHLTFVSKTEIKDMYTGLMDPSLLAKQLFWSRGNAA